MNELRGKRVLVVGLARSGRAAARCLGRRGAVVTVTDSRPPAVFQDVIPELTALKVGLELGFHRTETFLRQDLVVVSPGVPWDLPQLQAARARGIQVVTEVEAASWFLTGRLIGITGTNGKTTTTAFLGKMLEASGLPTFVGGNIGIPLISAVDHVQPGTVLVTELSSFQLEAAQNLHPNVAVLLNITPNHLDRHASFQDYLKAKAKIFSRLTPADYAILNADDPNVMSLVRAASGTRRIFFSRRQNLPDGIYVAKGQVRYRAGHLERPLFDIRDVRLRGAFNLENVLAASAAACVVGADFDALRRAVLEFKGVEHRLEFVRRIRSVDFYNDSKGTSVDATAKALSAFERGVHLILGGKDKGAPYLPLVPFIKGRV
ncbi:MAG: UDP-N-acetylmuramoyl-L-alanine--D-glutamate ligase, partial [Acidobacteria bacterium]